MFSKLFYEHGGHPFELMLTKFVGAALVLGAISATRRSTLRNRGLILFGVGLGAFQLLANYGLLEGFDRAPAALVVLLFYVYPLIVTLAAVPIFGEPLGARRLAALAVGLCGVALTVGTPSSVPAMGVVLALGAALTTVGYV